MNRKQLKAMRDSLNDIPINNKALRHPILKLEGMDEVVLYYTNNYYLIRISLDTTNEIIELLREYKENNKDTLISIYKLDILLDKLKGQKIKNVFMETDYIKELILVTESSRYINNYYNLEEIYKSYNYNNAIKSISLDIKYINQIAQAFNSKLLRFKFDSSNRPVAISTIDDNFLKYNARLLPLYNDADEYDNKQG